ncbi:MAG: hypothetical protein HY695_28135 [Deltaproteobacteria bacterium]|nr:hypothetical protein [Deltaproteobacteria bacterium]
MIRVLRFFLMVSLMASLAATAVGQETKKEKQEAKKEKKVKVKDQEAVITNVGQRTITYQYDRKGKVREEVVGIDDQTYVERISREKVTLKDLKTGDKVIIRFEPDTYTPAHSVQVIGKGEIKKAGGED